MKYISKYEVDQIVDRLLAESHSLETRKQMEEQLGEFYTDAQKERIWHRYRFRSGKWKDASGAVDAKNL